MVLYRLPLALVEKVLGFLIIWLYAFLVTLRQYGYISVKLDGTMLHASHQCVQWSISPLSGQHRMTSAFGSWQCREMLGLLGCVFVYTLLLAFLL